jgi:hypothetical protein
MKKILLTCLSVFIALCLVDFRQAAAESPDDILVIANKSVIDSEITRSSLRTIFLKKRREWSSGLKTVAINDKDGTELRKAFQERVLEMTPNREKTYWQEQKIKKGITPPATIGNRLKAVYKIKGAVSYVYRKNYKSGVVKVILVLPAS